MTEKALRIENPLDPVRMATLKHWGDLPAHTALEDMRPEATVDCGWGRLIFGQTFRSPGRLAREICREAPGRRDVALYIRDPHVVVSLDPQKLFLDPSHTFRLPLHDVNLDIGENQGWRIRQIAEGADLAHDEAAINRLYQVRGMVPVHEDFLARNLQNPVIAILVVETDDSGEILGVVTGVDHVLAFNDPDQGASLWSLAVDPQCLYPGIGASLVKALAALFQARQRTYLDLSVMHDNAEAIALYRKLGFQRVPVYCVKHKNPINEKLFVGPDRHSDLNIYARIIVDEARRRGIAVDILDAHHGYFRLSQGGRSITCRESLSELTSAVAMSRCDDKRVTRNVLTASGLRMPAQILADDPETVRDFLARYQRVVVKPARGEQGHGVQVDLRTPDTVEAAITTARRFCDDVIVEEMVDGEDLRIIVIGYQMVAAATRRPAEITGDGRQDIRTLIEKQSRRRQAAHQAARCPQPNGRWIAKPGWLSVGSLGMSERPSPRPTSVGDGCVSDLRGPSRWFSAWQKVLSLQSFIGSVGDGSWQILSSETWIRASSMRSNNARPDTAEAPRPSIVPCSRNCCCAPRARVSRRPSRACRTSARTKISYGWRTQSSAIVYLIDTNVIRRSSSR